MTSVFLLGWVGSKHMFMIMALLQRLPKTINSFKAFTGTSLEPASTERRSLKLYLMTTEEPASLGVFAFGLAWGATKESCC